ncbi:MAG: acyltransferase family protein [Fibrobacteria bacterium]|nr:acyltransferase family protein [Fibrobacteria bacterium]
MILLTGVFFHAAFIYSPAETDWFVRSAFQNSVFDTGIAFIRNFRMEALFIVSGFFSALLVSRSGSRGFMVNRAIRMGVPLLFCGIIFNGIMVYFSDDPSRPTWNFRDYVMEGQWQAHLWNVGNLLGYEVVIFSCLRLLPRIHRWIADSAWVAWLALPGYVLVTLAATRVWGRSPDLPFIGIVLHTQLMADYLAPYLLGYVLHQNAGLRRIVFRWPWSVSALGSLLGIRWTMSQFGAWDSIPHIGHESFDILQRLVFSLILFGLFTRFQTGNPWVKRISIASYSIYLLHLPLQILLFRALDPYLGSTVILMGHQETGTVE